MMKTIFTSLFLFVIISSIAQNVTITPSGITPASGGVQKMTYEQILAISDPEIGDIVIDISNKTLRMWNGTEWSYFLSALSQNNVILTGSSIAGDSIEYITSIDFDSNNNRYIAGVYTGSIIFGTDTLYHSGGTFTTFLLKQDSEGVIQWFKISTGSGGLIPWKMRIDSNDNIFIAGDLEGEVNLWDAGGTLTSDGANEDITVIKLNNNGIPLWNKVFGGSQVDNLVAIDLDGVEDLVITGKFRDKADFDGNSLTSLGNTDTFIAKLSSSTGGVSFLKQLGNAYNVDVYDLKVNSAGHYIIAGEYGDVLNAGSFTLPAPSLYNSNFFLLKLNPVLNSYLEGEGFGNSDGNSGFLLIDDDDNIYFSGVTEDSLNTGNFSTRIPTSSNTKTEPEIAFILKLSNDFEYEDIFYYEGAFLSSIRMAMNNEGNIMTGFLTSSFIRLGNSSYFSNKSAKSILGEIDPHQGILLWSDEIIGQSNTLDLKIDTDGNAWAAGINGGDLRFGNTHLIAPQNYFEDPGQIDAFIIKVVK
ncbi:hypothetical protein [uncultured Arcticibacterium sp.]|uniref:hypothetical protein n=1 Tax=uncultured Arcticibacterium sp. TaxID=2173042 RepID=UPI0030F9B547